ncbi:MULTISPECIES: AMP-binding protein [Rhodomicrobium]|uniref:phenylacetate--CoA ligase family protein n=1 Tax=Rhodomicrobium TaxID=1068 RepID=UPI000B4A7880|nr:MULTISPECIES: AMP-binding protein [Rhodomicrobium]
MAGPFFDTEETRLPEAREEELLRRLPSFIETALQEAPGWARHLASIGDARIATRADLARLPLLRKSDLPALQAADPPFGGLVADRPIARIMVSPGPVLEPQRSGDDPWRMARALFAAGFRPGEIIHNAFAYHLTPAGFMLDEPARALGCTVIPAGVGNTEQQAETIIRTKPAGYVGTPDYLKALLDRVGEMQGAPCSITKALVSGGALLPSMRADYAARGVAVLQCYATAELGLIAYETGTDGGMIVNEGIILEIVRPGTGEPVPDGEIGEVVVTNFDETYPLIRFATGDLSAILPGRSPCGRTGTRIKGWMGRADQSTKVKGLFVHPLHVTEIGKRHPELGRLRLVVRRAGDQDEMLLQAESHANDEPLRGRLAETLNAVTRLKGTVELVAPGSLPDDGKLIADERDYA